MKLKTPINENYAATMVTINHLIALDNCDNVVHANIFGNLVVVGKDTKVGEKGLYFPVETRLSDEFLHENNLYREKTKNKDTAEKGYFEDNGRIRCVKFRGHKSEGLFLPVGSLLSFASVDDLATLADGDTFDEINGLQICEKYVPRFSRTPGLGGKEGGSKYKKVPRIVDGQFRFHEDTGMLGKNIHKILPDTIFSITNKIHGTSFVVGNLLCRRKLGWFERLLKRLGVKIDDKWYDLIYSSRKVVKNDDLNRVQYHFYGEDLWGDIKTDLAPFIKPGMTVYGEAAGFTKGGKAIQSGYDYGYPKTKVINTDYDKDGDIIEIPYGIFIYRITDTNVAGDVHEWSARQVQDWCRTLYKEDEIRAVPEFFYGKASEIFPWFKPADIWEEGEVLITEEDAREKWQHGLLESLQKSYNMEELCYLCTNKVPAEGLVVRLEVPDFLAYKLKSFRFREMETKLLDKGEVDLETQQSQGGE